jgi:hypothetical protein
MRNPQLKLRAIVGRRCATEANAHAGGAGMAENLRRALALLTSRNELAKINSLPALRVFSQSLL